LHGVFCLSSINRHRNNHGQIHKSILIEMQATAQKKVQDLNEIKLKHKEKNRFLKQRQDYLKQSE